VKNKFIFFSISQVGCNFSIRKYFYQSGENVSKKYKLKLPRIQRLVKSNEINKNILKNHLNLIVLEYDLYYFLTHHLK
jgi:hypothetical protein